MADAAALLGTWRMVSWTRTAVATGKITDAMGADPIGYIAYHADGRMMALVVDRHRAKLKGTTPTDDEKVALFDSMLAFRVVYARRRQSRPPCRCGLESGMGVSDLIRPYTLEGDTLVISGAPGEDPVTGEAVVYRMEFRKVR